MFSPTFPEFGLRWRITSYSSPSGDNCVEVADAGHVIAVRDSKNPTGPALAFSRADVAKLTSRIKAGQLDL